MRRRCVKLLKSQNLLLSFALASLVLVITWYREYPVFQRSMTSSSTTSVTTTVPTPTTTKTKTTSKFNKLPYSSCPTVNHISFLKIHKSGSTTITNILGRYAIRNDLNVVLPNKKEGEYGFNFLGHGRNFTMKSVIPIPKGEHYHILCNHVIYNRTMFRKLLPNGTFYFAIVREPEDRFISAAFYYGLVSSMKKKVPGVISTQYVFTEWLKNPWKYGVSMESYNHVAYDFGVEMKYFNNRTYLEKYIRSLDEDFHLVLLMDYFDESLMLLRRKLCWSMKDLIYLKRNSGSYTTKYALSEQDRKLLNKWQMADRLIYEHFKSRFWRQVEVDGRGLFLETAFFKDVLRRASDYCQYGKSRWPSIDIEASQWSDVITVTKYDCQLMDTDGLSLVKKLQRKAWERYNGSVARNLKRKTRIMS